MTNTINSVPRELKPCPFCGSEAKSDNGFSPAESIVYAWCSNNECALHLIDDCGFTPETWNTRAPSPAGVDGLEVVGYSYGNGILINDTTQPDNPMYTKLVRLSDAQAIIDWLRGEVAALQADGPVTVSAHSLKELRDQHAQRISELVAPVEEVQAILSAHAPVQQEVFKCHKCLTETSPPAPYKAYVECGECGAKTAVTAAAQPVSAQPAGEVEIPDIAATFDGLYLVPIKPLERGDHLMAITQHARIVAALKARNDARDQRDQQARRIGELEGLLREWRRMFDGGLESGQLGVLRGQTDAALSELPK